MESTGDDGINDSPVIKSIELGDFLREWKEEIVYACPPAGLPGVHNLRKRSCSSHSPDSDAVDESSSHKSQRQCERATEQLIENDTVPLLVLPPPEISSTDLTCDIKSQTDQRSSEQCHDEEQSGSLVDKLISDLNEVNTIPFFDVQLPREVALIIFGHLSMRDLCSCSAVSRSWNSLADDNMLWSNICRQMGYNTITDLDMDVHWKVVVKEIIEHRKQVLQNWKERKCGVRDHQPDSAGVLTAVSYSEQTLLSCYTSGQVNVWRIGDHSEPSTVKYLSMQEISVPTCCATSGGWGAVGTKDGRVRVIDADTCSEVQCLVEAGSVGSLDVALNGGKVAIAAVTHQTRFNGTAMSKITTFSPRDDNTWERLLPVRDCSPITQMKLVSLQEDSDKGLCILYSTSTSLTLQPFHSASVPILTSSGQRAANCISCFDTYSTDVACGTSAFGYKVQVYEMLSGSMKSSLRGHSQHVTCVNISQSSPELLVSGSADKHVRVFDCRSGSLPVMTLHGHSSTIRCLKMDDWRVVSGSSDGCLVVWDQRLVGELWRSHERESIVIKVQCSRSYYDNSMDLDRHPVALCDFDQNFLVACFIPTDKQPVISSGNPFICHRRHRGLIRMYDFSVDPLNYRNLLPSICSSAYDEPSASFYNLDLKYPYDCIA